jgi:CBS domain-containing protein
MQAQDIMTKHVVSIAPTASIRQAVNLMLEKKVSGIPVVEDGDKLCGILTEGDLLRRKEIGGTAGGSEAGDQITSLKRYIQSQGWCVSDVMSRDVATVGRNAPLDRIADIMLSRSIKRVPVVDDGHLVGCVLPLRRGCARSLVLEATGST